ncbi:MULTISPECIES: YqgE/AlgH family protein [Oceanospirillaceae]|jgi:putative transcriptional regulator|uniref:UPF0301 protein WG929_04595 n=1 Tax=Oceanobacter antarcticus TaxID=3133425 RepID=A0ABW8NFM2_9GAMM|tara:strand:- start:14421 stop:14978 length:558 start_codon:yes stop_codon:yes gene_type:complete
MKELNSLGNQLLIAMPQLQDSWFESAVIYLCEHDQDGAMGLVLNKPLDVDFAAVCEQLAITRHQDINAVMLGGGPVGTEQGFILHQQPGHWNATETISAFAHLTSSKDILTAIGQGAGPDNYRLALGYSGWGPGQLDEEILGNSWLTVEADAELLFDTPPETLYQAALNRLGVSGSALSAQIGHA